ncbi:hypothetical protein JTE90_016541 [Oedothorax gibbosus]|uniref:Globin domain-containing protein n=2 Tax=Oedothorax gibbosus TaxID=931172 RepID=A0AAV6U6T8_9ARAC|nr:hypothetical protein JTE90_016541 [Oedothorax gibbosus]
MPKEDQLKIFNRKLGYIKGQVTRLNSLLLEEGRLEHSDILQKVSTIEKLKEKIDDLRNESYCELSDDDLKTFEPSLDTQQSDLETLECNSHNSLIHDAKVGQRKKGNDLESNLEALNPCNDSKGSPPEDVSCFFSGNKTPKNNVLLSTAKIRIKNQDDMLDTCLYVDDWVCAFSDVSSALKVSREAKDIMTDANMNLCKWSSNSDKLVQLWKNNDFHIHPIHSEDTCESDKLHKVLGLPWHIQQDYITLDVTQLLDFDEKSSVTKRLVLSTSGKIFDVLGLVTPYTIRLKCLFQELWLRKISWDDELPADLHQTFIQWRSELFNLADLRVPRNILDCSLDGANDLQIHIFSDASQKAYGTAAYLRVKNGDHIEAIDSIVSLFETHPDVQDVFMPFKGLSIEELRHSNELRAHGLRVMGFVLKVVARLDEPEKANNLLRELGKNHVMYGAPRKYVTIPQSVELKQLIGPQFVYSVKPSMTDHSSEEIEESWLQLFRYMAYIMKQAMLEKIKRQNSESPQS